MRPVFVPLITLRRRDTDRDPLAVVASLPASTSSVPVDAKFVTPVKTAGATGEGAATFGKNFTLTLGYGSTGKDGKYSHKRSP